MASTGTPFHTSGPASRAGDPAVCPAAGRWQHDQLLHAWWVDPGRLLAGEYPGAKTPAMTLAKVALLLDAGITTFIDLTTDKDRLAPYTAALRHAALLAGRIVHHYSHPIPDMGVIDPDGYDVVVDLIRAEIGAGRSVYVHCWGGMGRTTTVIGALLIDQGLDYPATITRIAQLRAGTRKDRIACPQSKVQHDLLRARSAPHHAAALAAMEDIQPGRTFDPSPTLW